MSYTLQQLQQMGATPVVQPTSALPPQKSYSYEELQKMGAVSVSPTLPSYQPTEQKPNILGSILRNLGPGGPLNSPEFGMNVIKSTGGLISGLGSAIAHPIKTIKGLGSIGAGAIQSIPGVSDWFDKNATEKGKPILEQNRQAFKNIVDFYGKRYGGNNVQEVVKNIGNTAYTDPVGFALDLSILLGGGETALVKAGEMSKIPGLVKAGETVGKIGETINPIRQGTNVISEIGGSIKKLGEKITPPQTLKSITGRITQGKPFQIPSAQKGLTAIDTTGVKTYQDLSNKLQTQIDTNLKAVDTELAKYPEQFKPADLTKKFKPELGGKTAKINYIQQAINDFKSLYSSIKEPQNLVKIQDLETKFKTQGLTSKEINDFARQYGTEFGRKAFGKNGEPLTGVNSQAYENIRTGLKENARGLLPNETTKVLDKQTTDIIRTKELSDNLNVKVQQLQNKLQNAGILQKAGALTGRAVDMLSGSFIKGLTRNLLGIGAKGGKTLNAVEIQAELQKNLSILDKLNSAEPIKAANDWNNLVNSLTWGYYAGKAENINNQ